LNKPNIKRLGSEFSGVVEAIGNEVSTFKVGDAVFGYPGSAMGAYAEYMIMPENGVLTHKPRNVSHEEAAVLPYGAVMAFYLMKKMNIQPGQKVLILGASGNIGSAAVQIAKGYGAEVTGVCGAHGIELVKTLGADKAINYAMEDFTQNGEQYDLIFDVLGKGSFAKFKGSLKPNGRYLLSSFKGKQLLQMLWTSLFGSQKVICILAPGSREDLLTVKEWIEAGKIKAAIDRSFSLEETANAHAYVESGVKKGSVAIVVKN
jgi:NADPH:quinone reductase-like Zn-dependent oxidoreductase